MVVGRDVEGGRETRGRAPINGYLLASTLCSDFDSKQLSMGISIG